MIVGLVRVTFHDNIEYNLGRTTAIVLPRHPAVNSLPNLYNLT